MVELSLKIIDKYGNVQAENINKDEVSLVYQKAYEEGDKVVLNSSEKDVFLMAQVDDALGSALIYVRKNEIIYHIPFAEKRVSYSPKVFYGELHLLCARVATDEEVSGYRNLALNVMDQHEADGYYPHTKANVETRGEAVFASRNAIDGVRVNNSHGPWPYQSWGINMQDDAMMRLEFGRKVLIDKIVLYTRAHFPHDNWWKEVSFLFSDGSKSTWELEKSDKAHIIEFEKKEVEWLEFYDLIKADDPSPFPALTQIEVYGVEITGN